jgi:hypothetical protein
MVPMQSRELDLAMILVRCPVIFYLLTVENIA